MKVTVGRLVTIAACWAAVPGRAHAQALVVADPLALPELRHEAAAVSFLLRGALHSRQRPVTPVGELRRALSLRHTQPGAEPAVAPGDLPALMRVLSGDRALLWGLRSTRQGILRASGVVYGPEGQSVGRVQAAAPAGAVAELARALATSVAVHAPGRIEPIPLLSMPELWPFVAADTAAAAGELVTAARALQWASPVVAARLPRGGALLRQLTQSPQVGPDLRSRLLVVAGDPAGALRVADQALFAAPADPAARASHVRALTASGRLGDARAELTALRPEVARAPAVGLAAAELAIARKDHAGAAVHLGPMLRGSDPRAALALVAASAPPAVGQEVTAMTVAAARRLAVSEAALAGDERFLLDDVGMHALASGDPAQARAAAKLVRASDLSEDQMSFAQSRIEAMKLVDDPALATIKGDIDQRATAAATVRDEVSARATHHASPLASELLALLRQFDALYHPYVAGLTVVDLPGSDSPFYSPFVPLPARLRAAVAEAAGLAPYELPAALASAPVQLGAGDPDEATLRPVATQLLSGGEVLLMGRLRVTGLGARTSVELVMFDPRRGLVEKSITLLPGLRYGLVQTADWVWSAAVAAVLLSFIWGLVVWLRGSVVVRIQYQTDAQEELFTLELSRTAERPRLDDPEVYRASFKGKRAGQSRTRAWAVGRLTTFKRVPRGRWFVSLHGVYKLGKRTVVVNDAPLPVVVRPRRASALLFDLQNRDAEFEITVHDEGQPVAGAKVWVDDQSAGAVTTNPAGVAIIRVAHGERILNIAALDVIARRPYQVIKAKRHEMNVNLALERRRGDVSRALEQQQDDPLTHT